MAAITVKNTAAPIHLTDVRVDGFSLENAREGDPVEMQTYCAITSDQPIFHRLVPNFVAILEARAQHAGAPIALNRAATVLVVIKPDDSAELYVDTAAVSLYCLAKRDVAAGAVVFEHDIADVTAMAFPAVTIDKADKAACIFRLDWRFGFCADFNPHKDFDHDRFQRSLGTLYRRLKYRNLYDILDNSAAFERLVEAGWFPFVELIGPELQRLADFSSGGLLDVGEKDVLAAFTPARIDRITQRWRAKPHFSSRLKILEEGVVAFKSGNPISSIKVLVTEIEGILQDSYKGAKGRPGRMTDLLKLARTSATVKAGADDTILLPSAFMAYLDDFVFANFNPAVGTSTSSSRHAVGHGAAPQDSYTMVRALQAILTVDQLAFYL